MPRTAAERLRNQIAGHTTAALTVIHRAAAAQFWTAVDAKADAEPLSIVLSAIGNEFLRREVPLTLCCAVPVAAGWHDERICDRTAPAALLTAADVICDALISEAVRQAARHDAVPAAA